MGPRASLHEVDRACGHEGKSCDATHALDTIDVEHSRPCRRARACVHQHHRHLDTQRRGYGVRDPSLP